jgi:outer membrane protein, adhesin transport system
VDETEASSAALEASEAAGKAATLADPRATLQALVREALMRSHQVGAARLNAEAALDDIAETRAGKALQASMGAGLGPGGSQTLAGSDHTLMQFRASVHAGQLLYDGGRVDRLTDWRTQLAESAHFGHLNVSEQLALNTVSLALERSRFHQQMLVYGQQVRKMGCLVQALEIIVQADRGRASEMVQARKSLQQAELAQAQAASQFKQVEVRLRRIVGDKLPPPVGLSSALLQVPDLQALQDDVERSSEVSALTAQAKAMARYMQALAATTKPQVSWNFSGAQAAGLGGKAGNLQSNNYALGLAVNVPLVTPSALPATEAARKRARAAELQRAEAVEVRRFRAAEVHEQAVSTFERARRVGAVLRDSEQVRNFTLQQWQQLGRRSLFDVMGAESEHFNLRISYVNALHDGQQLNANLLSLGRGVNEWLK